MNKLIAFLSWPAAALLAALGWRLQGTVLAILGGVIGLTFVVWANDWEVRQIVKGDREAKRLGDRR